VCTILIIIINLFFGGSLSEVVINTAGVWWWEMTEVYVQEHTLPYPGQFGCGVLDVKGWLGWVVCTMKQCDICVHVACAEEW